MWTPTRYLRIDGNTANNIFIESQGRWLHNGIEIKFDKNTITGYIDQGVVLPLRVSLRKDTTTQNSLMPTTLENIAQAVDSAKLGGQAYQTTTTIPPT